MSFSCFRFGMGMERGPLVQEHKVWNEFLRLGPAHCMVKSSSATKRFIFCSCCCSSYAMCAYLFFRIFFAGHYRLKLPAKGSASEVWTVLHVRV